MNDRPSVERLLDLPPDWRGREVFRSTVGRPTLDPNRPNRAAKV
jgi:hypothetical protein